MSILIHSELCLVKYTQAKCQIKMPENIYAPKLQNYDAAKILSSTVIWHRNVHTKSAQVVSLANLTKPKHEKMIKKQTKYRKWLNKSPNSA